MLRNAYVKMSIISLNGYIYAMCVIACSVGLLKELKGCKNVKKKIEHIK